MNNNRRVSRAAERFYAPAPGLEIIPLGGGEWLCHSATQTSRIGGSPAQLVVERILPLLKKRCRWSHLVAQLPDIEPAQLRALLDDLAANGILRCNPGPPANFVPTLGPLLTLLDALNLPA